MRDLVESNIRWVFGRGRVDFWWDNWLFDELVSSYLEFDQPPHFLVAEFYDRDAWNEERLLSWVPMHIVCVINDVYFQSSVKDELVWLPSSSGSFTITSAWNSLRQCRNISTADLL